MSPERAGASSKALALACLVFGVLLVVDALFLMAQGVFMLGVTLPFAIGCGLLFVGVRWAWVQRWLDLGRGRRAAWRGLWVAGFAWLCSVFAFWAVLARAAVGVEGQQTPKAIVVLGSGSPNGKPSPVLAARLDTALAQAAKFPQVPVVVSGGVDFNQTLSEGEVMGDYLRAKGLDPSRIVQEQKSNSTEENLLFSAPLLQQRGVSRGDAVQIVTSDFHTVRARWIARRAGYTQITTAGAPTPLYVRYNAWLREYFAVISGFVLREFA